MRLCLPWLCNISLFSINYKDNKSSLSCRNIIYLINFSSWTKIILDLLKSFIISEWKLQSTINSEGLKTLKLIVNTKENSTLNMLICQKTLSPLIRNIFHHSLPRNNTMKMRAATVIYLSHDWSWFITRFQMFLENFQRTIFHLDLLNKLNEKFLLIVFYMTWLLHAVSSHWGRSNWRGARWIYLEYFYSFSTFFSVAINFEI